MHGNKEVKLRKTVSIRFVTRNIKNMQISLFLKSLQAVGRCLENQSKKAQLWTETPSNSSTKTHRGLSSSSPSVPVWLGFFPFNNISPLLQPIHFSHCSTLGCTSEQARACSIPAPPPRYADVWNTDNSPSCTNIFMNKRISPLSWEAGI